MQSADEGDAQRPFRLRGDAPRPLRVEEMTQAHAGQQIMAFLKEPPTLSAIPGIHCPIGRSHA